MTGDSNPNYSTNDAPSKPLAINSTAISLYSNDHSDPYSFPAPKYLSAAPSHITQYGNINKEIAAVRYNETTSSSALSTSFTIEQSQVRLLHIFLLLTLFVDLLLIFF